jgi:hypothetical protein
MVSRYLLVIDAVSVGEGLAVNVDDVTLRRLSWRDKCHPTPCDSCTPGGVNNCGGTDLTVVDIIF